MSWNVNLKDVNPLPDTIPAEEFDFELIGAKYTDYDPNKIEVTARIATEGTFQGRRVYFTYPDPEKYGWSPKQLKRLEMALGVDSLVGEDPVAFLNRVSGNLFRSNVIHRSYTPEGSETPVTKSELNIFGVKPAAYATTSTAA